MPRRGVKHKQWDPKQMKLAVEAVKNKEMGKPQGISKARVKGSTPDNVNAFYDLESSFEKVNFDSARIYNVDETAVTSVQGKHSKVINNTYFGH
ncbi:nuclear hormone receptor [Holotrichia oblita]|uniref:Nuclear hormone receptor n=1 Tax=Holotrichia oblita TaxID=644536 RepID=A0ACB9T253_HOLOL|nr:nuclear hormone receptor [Holotrichia oblita]